MTEILHTLTQSCRHESVIERSRFLVHAAPVDDAEAALRMLAQVRDDDATHNCWAYRIADAYRSSDDGEPAGTAGRPILAAIDGQGMDRVVVVVTRWFGGTKLGAGGLVRAYGGTAAECLRLGERQPIIEIVSVACVVDFALEPTIRALLPAIHGEVVSQRYDAEGAHLLVNVPVKHRDALVARLVDLSRGRVRFPAAA